MIFIKLRNYQKKTILLSLLFLIAYANPRATFADTNTNCQPIYGGGTTCIQSPTISIDKKVLNPETGALEDNLTTYKFAPEQLIAFQITIKNTSGNTLSNITLKDILPYKYLTFYSGPGTFDNNTKTMTLTINTLNKDETRDYTIRALIEGKDIPDNQTICTSNEAQAIEGNQVSQDNAEFCISTQNKSTVSNSNPATTKGGLPIYRTIASRRTPSTGPEELAVFGLFPTGVLGWFIRKKTKL